jgi:hypothetical protein
MGQDVGVGEDVFPPHLVIQEVEPLRRLLLGLTRRALVGASESFQELPGSRQSPHLGSFKRTPNQGSFPPPALPGFLGTMSPSDACRARPPMEPLPGRPDSPTGLPCCESLRVHVPRPLPRRAGRPSRVGVSSHPRRSSSNERGLDARIQSFGACSGFTRVAARTR